MRERGGERRSAIPAEESPASQLKLMVVEDDPAVIDTLRRGLADSCAKFRPYSSIAGARAALRGGARFDLIVLDLELPDGNGCEFARQFRASGGQTPIIILTGHDAVQERVAGLEAGADDYVSKPFEVAEIWARIDAVLRRTRAQRFHVMAYEGVEVDVMKRELRRDTVTESLSLRELDLLVYFITHAEEALEKRRILRDVWGDETLQEDNLLQVYIRFLRTKLERDGAPRLIHTIRGVGYMFSLQEPDLP